MRPSNTMVFFEEYLLCKFQFMQIGHFSYMNPLFCVNDLLTVYFPTYYMATFKINELKGCKYQLKWFKIYRNTLPFKKLGSV